MGGSPATGTLLGVALTAACCVPSAAGAPPAPPRDGASGYTIACALNDQPGMQTCADLSYASACAHEADFASRPSKQPTGMTFVNRSDQAVNVHWLDFHAHRKLYRHLAPGDRFVQSTFIGHNWLVASQNEQCVGIFKAAPESLAFF